MEFKKYLITPSNGFIGNRHFDTEEEAGKWMDAVAESNPTVSFAKYILEGVYTNEVIVKEVRRLQQQK